MGGTLLVGQSGGPTAVVNASLFGVVEAVRRSGQYGRVLGALHGVEGILADNLVDMGAQSDHTLALLRSTPSAALGSCRYKLAPADVERILAGFRRHEVAAFVYIGGNDSADTSHQIAVAAASHGQEVAVIGVPKTIDNDLVETDHCPGYGSAARFVALAARETGIDTRAMRRTDPVRVIEVMGRHAGWLAAAAALGRDQPEDAPHVVLLPERPQSIDAVLQAIAVAVERAGYAVVVLSENQPAPTGGVLGAGSGPVHVDAFGHAYHESPGLFLANEVQRTLGLRGRYDKPGALQKTFTSALSEVDRDEAEACGRAAVERASSGRTDEMVVLRRADGPIYGSWTDTVPLEIVANRQRLLPPEFIAADGLGPSDAFLDYARPLIGGPLPSIARLDLSLKA